MSRPILFAGGSNPMLAQRILDNSLALKGELTIKRFSNENIKVKIEESVRGRDVYVLQTSCNPVSDNIMELLIMVHALKGASADRITAVLPYFPYVRSDKKDEPRISITARLMADLLATAGADRVLTMDLHADQIHGFFSIPVDQLSALPVFYNHFKNMSLESPVIVANDVGRAKLNSKYAHLLSCPLAILDKRRHHDDEKAIVSDIIGSVGGRDVITFDDEILTGGSLMELIKTLKREGALKIYAGITHGVLSGLAIPNINKADIEKLYITDTIPLVTPSTKIEILSVSKLFGEAINRIHERKSISALFEGVL